MESRTLLDQFLEGKGIDAARFAQAMPDRYALCLRQLQGAGTVGLDYSQKFLWNDLRAEFPKGGHSLKKD